MEGPFYIVSDNHFYMKNDKSEKLQDIFLNQIRKEKSSVTIFLINGVKLQGIITWFDNFSVLLKRDNHIQLIYKHSISTIMPSNLDPETFEKCLISSV